MRTTNGWLAIDLVLLYLISVCLIIIPKYSIHPHITASIRKCLLPQLFLCIDSPYEMNEGCGETKQNKNITKRLSKQV